MVWRRRSRLSRERLIKRVGYRMLDTAVGYLIALLSVLVRKKAVNVG
jgi:hypothetical protein